MKVKSEFEFEIFNDISELQKEDAELLEEARKTTQKAYAPYSNFFVGAAAIFNNGEKVYGTNQENASYPVGICAERVLLASAAMLQTDEPIKTMAISYNNLSRKGVSDQPISPCGMCRQSLAEYEDRTKQPMRIILSGMEGKVMIIESATQLLPFSFGGDSLK
ncbi:cytidine deaminase [Ferruginibacter yonginensis]|uniref:Cytidine deaminase n=1 Tax=Ferruginibacter yonginensis TaxID=1310416 RepID=A0ABV8QP49_9BACT